MLWCGMITLQRIRAPLKPRPLFLVLLPTKIKSTVGQYRGRGPGQERGRRVEQTKVVWKFQENPKREALVEGK